MQLFGQRAPVGNSATTGPSLSSPDTSAAANAKDRLDELRETMDDLHRTHPELSGTAVHQLAIKRMAERRMKEMKEHGGGSSAAESTAAVTCPSGSVGVGGGPAHSFLDHVRDHVQHSILHKQPSSGAGDKAEAEGGGMRRADAPIMRRESHRDPFLNVDRSALAGELSGLDLSDDDDSTQSGERRDGGGGAASPINAAGGGGGKPARAVGLNRRSSYRSVRRSSGVSLRSIAEDNHADNDANENGGGVGGSDSKTSFDDSLQGSGDLHAVLERCGDGSGNKEGGGGGKRGKQRVFDDSLAGSDDLKIKKGTMICQWGRNSGLVSSSRGTLDESGSSLGNDISDSGLICGWASRRMSELSVDDWHSSGGNSGNS